MKIDKNDAGVSKIVLDGNTWLYKTVMNDQGVDSIALADGYGNVIVNFFNAEDMTDYIFKQVSQGKKDAQGKVQRIFMQRMQELKGDMNDSEFSASLEMKYDTLYQYMSGRRFPTVFALSQIADKAGVSMDWLVGRESA